MIKNKIVFLYGLSALSLGWILYLLTFVEFHQTEFFIRGLMMGTLFSILGLFLLTKSYRLSNSRFIMDRYKVRRTALFVGLLLIFVLVAFTLVLNNPSQDMIIAIAIAGIGITIGIVIQHIKQTDKRLLKIQEGLFEQSKFHENANYFSMIVDSYQQEDGKLFMHGIVHGSVQRNDKFYFYFPNQKVFKSKVYGILVDHVNSKVASNQPITLVIKLKEEIQLPPYTVISSAIAYRNNDTQTPITNPNVLGLLNGCTEQEDTRSFYNYLIDAIVHGNFLLIVDRDKQKQSFMDSLYDFFYGYHGIYRLRTVFNKEKKESLAIYTDWNQVSLSREPHLKIEEALVMSFDEVQKYVLSQNELDIVINPFSEFNFHMSRQLIEDIVSSEVYQQLRKK